MERNLKTKSATIHVKGLRDLTRQGLVDWLINGFKARNMTIWTQNPSSHLHAHVYMASEPVLRKYEANVTVLALRYILWDEFRPSQKSQPYVIWKGTLSDLITKVQMCCEDRDPLDGLGTLLDVIRSSAVRTAQFSMEELVNVPALSPFLEVILKE